MEKNKIEFKWIEGEATKPKKQISITAEIENEQLKLIDVKCFPSIICLTCGPAFNSCPQMA